MRVFDLPCSRFGLQPIGDDRRKMSGGSNTSRACIREMSKKESEKITAWQSTAAHVAQLTGAEMEDEARMNKKAVEYALRMKPGVIGTNFILQSAQEKRHTRETTLVSLLFA